MEASQKVNAFFGLLTGLVVGALVSGVISGFVAYTLVRKTEREARKGWVLQPVVVVAQRLEPGQKLAMDQLAERKIPEQLVTESVVKPDLARFIENQMITAPLNPGDPLYWGVFSTAKPGATVPGTRALGDNTVWEACHAALLASPTLPKRDRTSEDIRTRLASQEGK